MDESILTTIKKILGISEDYTAFDFDIIVHINSILSVLTQIGIGPEEGFSIEDDTSLWTDFIATDVLLYSMVKSYVALRVRMLFDPPTTSFLQEAINKQIAEYEWRMSVTREKLLSEATVVE